MVRVMGDHINISLPDVYDIPIVDRTFCDINFRFEDNLPHSAGIYFLISGTEIIYVGESDDISNRVSAHERLDGAITAVAYLVVPVNNYMERFVLEKLYIMAYKPALNNETKKQMEATKYV